jgi:hypothetical protein
MRRCRPGDAHRQSSPFANHPPTATHPPTLPQGGGQEMTILTSLSTFVHHGGARGGGKRVGQGGRGGRCACVFAHVCGWEVAGCWPQKAAGEQRRETCPGTAVPWNMPTHATPSTGSATAGPRGTVPPTFPSHPSPTCSALQPSLVCLLPLPRHDLRAHGLLTWPQHASAWRRCAAAARGAPARFAGADGSRQPSPTELAYAKHQASSPVLD